MSHVPEVPKPEGKERDDLIQHAQYMLDKGFIKNVTLDQLIKQIERSNARKAEGKPAPTQNFQTFGDLEDFM